MPSLAIATAPSAPQVTDLAVMRVWYGACTLTGAARPHHQNFRKEFMFFMNWDQIQGKWKQMKGSAKQQWGNLTDNDLEMIAGNRDKLVGTLQERYGYAKEEAQKRADEFAKNLNEPASARAQQPTGAQRQHQD